MNFRTCCKFSFACSVLLCAATVMAQAPASIFQLDGNPTNDNQTCVYAGGCDYWNLLNGTGGTGPIGTNSSAGNSSVRVFINGTTTTDSFTGGGSKDANPLSQWAYSTTPTPNKDTLDAGYAAAYDISDFDVIFGADRLSPNGDANIGIWFFQNSVTLNGTGGFNGSHANGDVFVISAFTGGGGTSTITVYAWNQPGLPNAISGGCSSGVKNPSPGQCAATNLLLLANPTTVCGASSYCAITNSGTVNATWASYATPANQLASPLFFEGGVDITAAFAAVGGTVPCFASFLEETRSSQSTTAVLKDFLLGGFPVCSMTISKSCGTASVSADGTSITYPVSGSVTNTGIGTLYNVAVKDCVGGSFDAKGNCSGTVDTINVGTVGPKSSAPWSDSSTSTSSSRSDQAFAVGSESSGGPLNLQSTNTASATCSLAVSTTLTVSKSCSTSITTAVNGTTASVLVSYGGQVCNTGPSKVTGISLEDYPDSVAITDGTGKATVATGITLGPGTVANPTCQSYGPFTYAPSKIDETISGGTGAGRYFFDDLITIPSATPAVGTLTKVSGTGDSRIDGTLGYGTARCPICQGSGECTAQ